MQSLRVWLYLLLLAALAPAARAEVAGQTDPAFVAAIDDWLNADEAAAIPALARLAATGNGAARLHLGLIDAIPGFQGPWLANLPRDRRLALLRAPGGVSGQSWLRAAEDPLARASVALWDGAARADLVLTIAALGEERAAHMAARQLFLREKRGFGALADQPDFPPALLPLAIRDWQREDPARAAAALAALPAGHPGRPLTGGAGPATADLYAWAKATPQLARHLETLRSLCPQSASPAKDLAAYLSQSGGVWALAWIGPPSARLIPPDRYATSPKAAEVARASLRAGAAADPARLAASPCIEALWAK